MADEKSREKFETITRPGATGLHTILDPQDIDDTDIADCKNVVFTGGYVQPRSGFKKLFSKPTGETGSGNTLAVGVSSDSVNYMIAVYGTNFYLWDSTNSQSILLNTGSGITYTKTPKIWSYVTWNAGLSSDVMYFANGVDATTKWQMALTTNSAVIGSSDTTITLTNGTKFPATGTVIVQSTDGLTIVSKSWTSKTGTNVLNLSSSLGTAFGVGSSVTIALKTTANVPVCSILSTFQRRLFAVGGNTTESLINYSKVNTPEDFTTTTGPNGAGAETLADGNGPIISVIDAVGFVLIGKANSWSQFSFIYSNDVATSKIVSLNEVISGKSSGTVNFRTAIKALNNIHFLTSQNGIMNMQISSASQGSTSSTSPIGASVSLKYLSEKINDRFRSGGTYFSDNAVAAYFNQMSIFALGTTSGAANSVLAVYDGLYDYWTVFDGWNVQDMETYNNNFYWLSNGDGSVNQGFTGNDDAGFGFTAFWKTKRFDFGEPALPKTVDKIMIQGYLDNITNLEVDILFDENGFLWKQTYHLNGKSVYVLRGLPSGTIGADTLGSITIGGSSSASAGVPVPFRAYLNTAYQYGFHNLQINFQTNQIGALWKIDKIALNPILENTYPSALVLGAG